MKIIKRKPLKELIEKLFLKGSVEMEYSPELFSYLQENTTYIFNEPEWIIKEAGIIRLFGIGYIRGVHSRCYGTMEDYTYLSYKDYKNLL